MGELENKRQERDENVCFYEAHNEYYYGDVGGHESPTRRLI